MSLFTIIKEQWMATPEELERGNKPRPFWPLKKKDKEAESVENLKTALKAVEEEITVAREGDNMTLLLKLQNESKRLKQKLSELEPISPPSEKSPQAEEEIPTPKEPVPETLQNQTSEVKAEPAPTPLMSSSRPDAYELTEENRKLKKELADIKNQKDKAETVEEPPVPTVPSPSKTTLEDLERQRATNMVALLFVLLGVLLAVVNRFVRFVPFLSPVVWLIVIIVYVLSLSGIARSTRLTILTKVVLILLALIYGHSAYGLVAKVSSWTLVPSLLATAIVFWITSMLLRYLKNMKVSLFQKTFVTVGGLILLIVLNTVAWKPLDTQVRSIEGARQDWFFDNLIDPQKSTQPAVTKVASTKASTTPKSTTADSTDVKPTLGTQKTNNLFFWILIPVGLFTVTVGLCSIVKPRRDSNDEE